jgi:hypothetical protein
MEMDNITIAQPVAMANGVGSYQLSPAVEQYIERYRTHAKRTVESILKLGETVVEAEEQLSRLDIMIFCQEVGIEHNGPTFRKLRKIGQQSARFLPVIDRVPNSWTTVYELAKLDHDQFTSIVEAEALTATSTMKELKAFIEDGDKKPTDTVSFSLTLKAKNAAQAWEIEAAMQKVAEQFGAKVKVSSQEAFDRMAFGDLAAE